MKYSTMILSNQGFGSSSVTQWWMFKPAVCQICLTMLLSCSLGGSETQITSGRIPGEAQPSVNPELDFLEAFMGKSRLWVITAPSWSDHYLRMMEQQIKDMELDGLGCRLAARDTLIVTIIQNAMMEGKVHRPNNQGPMTEEPIDVDSVTRLLHHLELLGSTFTMAILKKNMQVSERFPYPVRVEAILEAIDQLPLRKLEKLTGRGLVTKCTFKKRKKVTDKTSKKKLSQLMKRNVTMVLPLQPKQDKKAILRSKVQDILSGRSRFVIRKIAPNSKKQQGKEPDETKRVPVKLKSDPISPANEVSTRHSPEEDLTASREGTVEDPGEGKAKKKGKGKKKKGKKAQRDEAERNKKTLKVFLEKLQDKRRLLMVSSPSEDEFYAELMGDNEQYSCDLALRKVSLVSILGSEGNSSLTVQHYNPDAESTSEELSSQGLIAQLRREYKITSHTFSVVLTDYSLKPQKVSKAPLTGSALMDLIDAFPSRQTELEREKQVGKSCSKPNQQGGTENSLLRFVSNRRLLILSTPSEEDYSFQQQLRALAGQSCPLGIRHFALLKLVGVGPTASGSVELFPLNGQSQSENEPLSHEVVNQLRDQLKINREYFSMVVVGKDGEVKAWFPSPMWSLANIYDLVDSMELRVQEHKLQITMGISCPEDINGGDIGEEGYLYHRPEERR